MNKQKKRIIALAIAILLIVLAIATLVFALLDTPWAYDLFKVCLGLIVILPVLIYVYMLIAKVLKNDSQDNGERTASDSKNSRN